ncbi:MAG: DUF4268 domain-containing protein [Caldilineaceae bacterium]
MLDFGRIKRVNVRHVWPNEARDFTPWLAENLEKLGEVLGMDLELVEREASVGNFSLDILAKNLSTGHNVIIENQFGDTDHDHLGKMLTYAAGFDASTIIWISENVRDEHRQTIEWLNQHTDTETQFFALEIDVIQIDDSKPAFNFKPIVLPNEWHKTRKANSSDKSSAKGEAYRGYFQGLIDELRTKHSFTDARIAQPQNWYNFPTGVSGLTYTTSFAQGRRIRVELYIDVGDLDRNKRLFDWLIEQKEVLENEFGESLSWERMEERRASRITIYHEGSIEDSEEALKEIQKWTVQKLLTFRRVFSQRLKSYKKQTNAVTAG